MIHDLPPLQEKPSAWFGPEIAKQQEKWILELTPAWITELEAAAKKYLANGQGIGKMTQSDFNLPNFGKKLLQIQNELIHGIGFSIIRGLQINTYTEEEIMTIFFGIGAHLGMARSQNAAGHLIGHVRNLGMDISDPKVRIYQTNERQTFHTDSCDVVGLLCYQPAKEGGLSLLVSADTVFNEMHNKRPDLLQLLLEPIATDRRGEVPEGMQPYLLIPVFSYFKGYITPFYQRQYIESAQRFEQAPRLTEQHIEALDVFDTLCNSPELHLSMLLEKGDMQFVYNHAMLHDRTGFVDFDEIEKRRHLLRLWLTIPGDRVLPEIFASRFGSVEIGNRGGIEVLDTKWKAPLISDVM
jgi:hypothetical protein